MPDKAPTDHLAREIERADAMDRAIAGLETIVRLRALGKTLTRAQSTDYLDAISAFNDAAQRLEIRTIDDPDGTIDAAAIIEGIQAEKDRASARIKILETYKVNDQSYGSRMRELVRPDPKSGRPEGPDAPTGDQIRDMIAAREHQHDFAYPTSAEMTRWLPAEADETRAISDFANGASLFMNDFATRVAVYQRTLSPWVNLATVVNSDNGRPLVVPTLTGDPTVYTPGEGTAITASDVTLSSITVTPTGYKALMYVSAEALEDEEVNLTDLLAKAQARAISIVYGTAFTTAVLAGASNGGTAVGTGGYGTAAGAFFGYEDLIALEYGRAAPYRDAGNAKWVMANQAISKARKWKDAQGQYIWSNVTGGVAGTLDGYRVFEDPALANPGSATKSVVFGDFAAGLIVKASPIRVAVSSDFKFDTDQVAIKTVQRIALGVQDAQAIAYLVSANT